LFSDTLWHEDRKYVSPQFFFNYLEIPKTHLKVYWAENVLFNFSLKFWLKYFDSNKHSTSFARNISRNACNISCRVTVILVQL
jgi:hypothetical protein